MISTHEQVKILSKIFLKLFQYFSTFISMHIIA